MKSSGMETSGLVYLAIGSTSPTRQALPRVNRKDDGRYGFGFLHFRHLHLTWLAFVSFVAIVGLSVGHLVEFIFFQQKSWIPTVFVQLLNIVIRDNKYGWKASWSFAASLSCRADKNLDFRVDFIIILWKFVLQIWKIR